MMCDDGKPEIIKSRSDSPNCPRTCHHGLGENRASQDTQPQGTGGSRGATRRTFIKSTALGAAGLIAGPRLLLPRDARAGALTGDRGSRESKIVRAFHPDATSGWDTVNQEPVDLMVHAAVRELTGIADTAEAWKSLFPGITPDKRVSIKINLACGDVPTHPELVNAIIDGLLMMDLDGQQLPAEHIIVWDNDNAFLCPQTGYAPNWGGPGVQYVGTDHPDVGFDYTYTFPIDHPHDSTSVHHPSRIITEYSDYMVNAGVIKDHSDSGVTLCLKNHYGSFDNIAIYQMHTSGTYGDGHTRGEPELNRVLRDELGDKTKLWLIDGTFGLYDGGPGYTPPWHTPPNWAYNSVLLGFDTVAIDRIGTIKINEERANHGVAPVDPSHVIASAGDPYNLGTDDPAEIDLVEIDASDMTDAPFASPGTGGVVLLSPYPNPTRKGCTFRFHCADEAEAEILIVDVRGALVRRIASSRFSRGAHRFLWDGRDDRGSRLASGVYFCRLSHRGGSSRQRIVLIR